MKWHLHRRYRLIAWFKNPLPGTPFNSEVIGIKDIEITSGSAWTVLSHSLWDINSLSLPPLRLGIITKSWDRANKNVYHAKTSSYANINMILCLSNDERLNIITQSSVPQLTSKNSMDWTVQISAVALWYHSVQCATMLNQKMWKKNVSWEHITSSQHPFMIKYTWQYPKKVKPKIEIRIQSK